MKRLLTSLVIFLTILPGFIAAQNCECDPISDPRYGEGDCYNQFYEPDNEGPLAHQKERGMYVKLVKRVGPEKLILKKSILGLNHNEEHQGKNSNELYPKEQRMLDYINQANIDRVVFNGISWILQNATKKFNDKTTKDYDDTYEENLRRLICVLHQNDIEVSAAIYYGLTQTDKMKENPVQWHEYQVTRHDETYAQAQAHAWASGHKCNQPTKKREGDEDPVWRGDSVTVFPEDYANKVTEYETDEGTVIDTVIVQNYDPVREVDERGVMSPIDNMTMQARNLSLYQRRAHKKKPPESEYTGRCAMFDRAISEYEFWQYEQGGFPEYGDFQTVFDEYMTFVRYAKRLNDECEFHKYTLDVYLGHLKDDNDWFGGNSAPSGYTEQALADKIDEQAGRVYIANYREKPCDLFMHHVFNPSYGGPVNLREEEDFHHLYEVFANNGEGAADGKTKILPIFNVEHECLPDPDDELTGEEHMGKYLWAEDCRGEQAMDNNKSALGRAEGIFNRIKDNWLANQGTNYDNKLNGFQWFIYRHMNFNNGQLQKKAATSTKPSANDDQIKFYPNPVNTTDQIKMGYEKGKPLNYKIYSSLGKTTIQKGKTKSSGHEAVINVGDLDPGLYYLVVNNEQIQRTTQKIIIAE